ncbi:uncharacterized protein LOC136081610 [Hydra vulgaris]|uniref:Uncharacterized protein LOC136081610 n=1 Tax=Hydra vulgaris TaxID=6087 RepID=A0ABM4C0R4_HYDVU
MRAMIQDMEIFQAQQPTSEWNQVAANYLASLDADLFILCCHLLVKMSKNLVNPLSAPHMRDVIEDTIITSCSYFHSIDLLTLSKLTPEWLQGVISQRLDGAGVEIAEYRLRLQTIQSVLAITEPTSWLNATAVFVLGAQLTLKNVASVVNLLRSKLYSQQSISQIQLITSGAELVINQQCAKIIATTVRSVCRMNPKLKQVGLLSYFPPTNTTTVPTKITCTTSTKKLEENLNMNLKDSNNSLKRTKDKVHKSVYCTNFSDLVFDDKPNIELKLSEFNDFTSLFLKYNITSYSMLLYYLKKDNDFSKAHSKLPPNNTNNIINKLYTRSQSNFQVIPFHNIMRRHIVDSNITVTRLVGLLISFLKNISCTNGYNSMYFFDSIFDVLTLKDSKKITLFLIGKSNAGKSFITNILTSVYKKYEVGGILNPNNDRLSEFWLQSCIFTHIKKCEELIITTPSIAQEFKKLFEGNPSLLGNVKYKDNMIVPKTPIIISANGNSVEDIWAYVSSEKDAFKNRCYIFLLRTEITKMIQEQHLKLIWKHRKSIIARMYEIYLKRCLLRQEKATSTKDDLEGYSDEEATAIYL